MTTAAQTTEAPTTAAQTTEMPTTTAALTTEAPTTAAQTADLPTTAAQTTDLPTTAAQTTEALTGTTTAQTTEAPTTAAQTTEIPITTEQSHDVITTNSDFAYEGEEVVVNFDTADGKTAYYFLILHEVDILFEPSQRPEETGKIPGGDRRLLRGSGDRFEQHQGVLHPGAVLAIEREGQ